MRLKIAPYTPGLCVSCRHGLVTEDSKGDTATYCNVLMQARRITMPIMRCTDYEDKRHESEHEMRKIAWMLNTDKKGAVGFRPPKKDDE